MDTFDPFSQDASDGPEIINFASDNQMHQSKPLTRKIRSSDAPTNSIPSSSSNLIDIDHQLSMKDEKIRKLQKEMDEMKFFHELESGKDTNDTNSAGNSSSRTDIEGYAKQNEALRRQIARIESENSILLQNMTKVKKENSELQASIRSHQQLQQAMNENDPKASNIYKKALKFQSELTQMKSTLQEEILARERAETNLDCFKLESQNKLSIREQEYNEMRENFDEMSKDLEEGVMIMKGLEEELLLAQSDMEEERQKRKESEESSKVMGNDLSTLKERCEELESQIGTYSAREKELKENLEENMTQLEHIKKDLQKEQDERQSMKELRESSSEEWSKEKAALEEELLKLRAHHEEELNILTAQHGEHVRNLEKELERRDEELNSEKQDLEIIEEMTQSLAEKQNEIESARETIAEMTEGMKILTSLKAKDHQHMREKKKWVSAEQKLRQELSTLQNELITYQEDHKRLQQENMMNTNHQDTNHSFGDEIMGRHPPNESNVDWMSNDKTLIHAADESTSSSRCSKTNNDVHQPKHRIENDQIRKYMQRQRQRKAYVR